MNISQWLRGLFGREAKQLWKSRNPARATARLRFLDYEGLEDRRLLTIAWSNRGSDNFSIYGANEAAARNIVDHAIADWNRLLPTPQAIAVTINAANISSPNLGVTAPHFNGLGRPDSAVITLDSNGDGAGWFFDTTPTSDSEFNNLVTVFTGTGSVSGVDFYSTVAHELGHAMGITTHFAQAEDLMSANLGPQTRKLITQTDINWLVSTYGYTTYYDPVLKDTLYVNQDPNTGNWSATGFSGSNADSITVSASSINVNGAVEEITGGSGTINSGDGNDTISITSASVDNLNAGNGNDSITITSGSAENIVAGSGDDFISIVTDGAYDIDGGTGFDLFVYNGGTTGTGYEYNYYNSGFSSSSSLGRNYRGIGPTPHAPTDFENCEDIALIAGSSDDLVTVSGPIGVQLRMYLLGGNDTVYGSAATTPIFAFGGTGNDSLTGGSAADMLSGNEGNDTFVGNGARDLIFGGTGADLVPSNNDSSTEDLVVTNNTNYDSDYLLLGAIRDEWLSSRTTSVRIANITNNVATTPRGNGNIFLVQGVSMFYDSDVDTTYADGVDWVFYQSGFDVTIV